MSNTVYDDYFILSQNMVLVKQNHQLGVMNGQGQLVLKCEYDEVKPFGINQFRVRKLNRWGVVDNNEKSILSLKYSKY